MHFALWGRNIFGLAAAVAAAKSRPKIKNLCLSNQTREFIFIPAAALGTERESAPMMISIIFSILACVSRTIRRLSFRMKKELHLKQSCHSSCRRQTAHLAQQPTGPPIERSTDNTTSQMIDWLHTAHLKLSLSLSLSPPISCCFFLSVSELLI